MCRRVIESLDGADGVTLSAHCHKDLGLGVANALAAIQAGARQLEINDQWNTKRTPPEMQRSRK